MLFNQLSLKPDYIEKKKIKRTYNWVGGSLLIHLAILYGLTIGIQFIVMFLYATVLQLPDGIKPFSQEFSDFISEMYSGVTVPLALTALISSTVANFVVFLIGCKATDIKPKKFFVTKTFDGKFVMKACIVILGLQSASAIIFSIISIIIEPLGITMTTPEFTGDDSIWGNVIMSIYACIFAPIFEELLFRGFVLKNLSRYGQRFAIITSALIFGLWHGNFAQFILATIIGIAMAYITVKSGSIIPAIIVHFVNNLTATVLGEVAGRVSETTSGLIALGWYGFTIIGMIVIIAVNASKLSIPKSTIMHKYRTWPLFFSSCTVIILFILYIIQIAMSLEVSWFK